LAKAAVSDFDLAETPRSLPQQDFTRLANKWLNTVPSVDLDLFPDHNGSFHPIGCYTYGGKKLLRQFLSEREGEYYVAIKGDHGAQLIESPIPIDPRHGTLEPLCTEFLALVSTHRRVRDVEHIRADENIGRHIIGHERHHLERPFETHCLRRRNGWGKCVLP